MRNNTYRPGRHGPLPATVPVPTTPAAPAGAPAAVLGAEVCPSWLSEPAIAIWSELAPLAMQLGTLTLADRHAFSVLCELEATLRAASREKANGTIAAFKLERDTAAAIRPWYEAFGFTAGARARLRVTLPTAPDAADAFGDTPLKRLQRGAQLQRSRWPAFK